MPDQLTATTEILDRFATTWAAGTPAIAGSAPPVGYDGKKFAPPTSGPYAFVTVRHTVGGRTDLSGDGLTKRFTHIGVVTVAVHAPISLGSPFQLASQLARIPYLAFAVNGATASEVWFRDVRTVEVSTVDSWSRFDVVAEFTYDDVAAPI